jgi:hypothetical protein
MAQLLEPLLIIHSLITIKNNNMITTNEKLTEVLNDLIQINNDRITGYEKASKETEKVDVDLRAIFSKMADESRKYKSELTEEVSRLGGEPATGTTNLGKIIPGVDGC